MSYCTIASCLAHREEMFVRLDLPDSYPWVHVGGMRTCGAMPPATAAEAGEVCACGHGRHEADPGPLPHGLIAKPRPCTECPCPDFTHGFRRAA